MDPDKLLGNVAKTQQSSASARLEGIMMAQVKVTKALLEAVHDLAKLIDPEKAESWPTPQERIDRQ